MKKGLLLVIMLITALSSTTHAHRDLETGTFLTRDPIGYGDGPNLYCYVHCNPITSFDAWGLETIEQYNEQIDEVNQQYSEQYGNFRSEHYDDETHTWDSNENRQKGLNILNEWRETRGPLQSARDAIISSTKAFNEAFGKEIADGKMNSLDPLKVDDDFINPSDLSDLAFDKNVEKICLNTMKNVVKYYVLYESLMAFTAPQTPQNPLDKTTYTPKVEKQMRPNLKTGQTDNHGFPKSVDAFAGTGKQTTIAGGDGVDRTLVELKGGHKGKEGTFEWIIDPDKSVNHRYFNPNQ